MLRCFSIPLSCTGPFGDAIQQEPTQENPSPRQGSVPGRIRPHGGAEDTVPGQIHPHRGLESSANVVQGRKRPHDQLTTAPTPTNASYPVLNLISDENDVQSDFNSRIDQSIELLSILNSDARPTSFRTKIRFANVNSTGFRKKQAFIFDLCANNDVICVEETFLEESRLEVDPVHFPPSFHYVLGSAARESRSGRASGGILVFFRRSMFLVKPQVISSWADHVFVRAKLVTGEELLILGCYRAPDTSPAFRSDFFDFLEDQLFRGQDLSLPMVVMGDFNSRLGLLSQYDSDTEPNLINVIPLHSLDSLRNDEGMSLACIMSAFGFHNLFFSDPSGAAMWTYQAHTHDAILDFIFVSNELSHLASSIEYVFDTNTSHAIMTFVLEGTCTAISQVNCILHRTVRPTIDWSKISVLAFPHELITQTSYGNLSDCYNSWISFFHNCLFFTEPSRYPNRTKPEPGVVHKRRYRALARTKISGRSQAEVDGIRREMEKERKSWSHLVETHDAMRRHGRIKELFSSVALNNMKRAWVILKSVNSRAPNQISMTGSQLCSHFRQIYADASNQHLQVTTVPSDYTHPTDHCFSGKELENALNNKHDHKAVGPDAFPIDILRVFRFDEAIMASVADLMTRLYHEGFVPDVWKKSLLSPLYKGKGDPNVGDNYRGISLSSHFLKLFETVILKRVQTWSEENDLLPPHQAGFRPGFSTVDHIFVLNHLIQTSKIKQKKLQCMFIDIRKAFPSVPRQELFRSLENRGLSLRTIRFLSQVYSNETMEFMTAEGEIFVFSVEKGVREGSVFSPFIFIVYFLPVHEICDSIHLSDPVFIGDAVRVSDLVYADDVLLLAWDDGDLLKLADAVGNECSNLGLTINSSKSEVWSPCAAPTSGVPIRWAINGKPVPSSESVRYLGAFFKKGDTWGAHFEQLLPRYRCAAIRVGRMCREFLISDVYRAIVLFDAIALSVASFASPIWALESKPKTEQLDRVFVNFLKCLLGIPRSTNSRAVLAECGQMCFHCHVVFLSACFVANAKSSSKNDLLLNALLEAETLQTPWFRTLRSELSCRGVLEDVLLSHAIFVADRLNARVRFSQFCLINHLLQQTGRPDNALFCKTKLFGRAPYMRLTGRSRAIVISARLGSWKWLPELRDLRGKLTSCPTCRVDLNARHLLLDCHSLDGARIELITFCEGKPLEGIFEYEGSGRMLFTFFMKSFDFLKREIV